MSTDTIHLLLQYQSDTHIKFILTIPNKTEKVYIHDLHFEMLNYVKIIKQTNDCLNFYVEEEIIYRIGFDIPDSLTKKHLEDIANLDLWDFIFHSADPNNDFEPTMRILSEMGSTIKIRCIEFPEQREFIFPWGLIYDKVRTDDEEIDPKSFWGFKHIINQIPNKKLNPILDVNNLIMSFNYDPNIDYQFRVNCIKKQENLFDNFSNILTNFSLIKRISGKDFTNALSQKKIPESIIYFFCHAESGFNNKYDRSEDLLSILKKDYIIRLSDQNTIALSKLKRYYKDAKLFERQPLIFMNACESLAISPFFYFGFLPYFLEKGASGIVGTLAKIPTIFGTEFAMRFFKHFLLGEKVDNIIHTVRNEFLNESNNILGLYYTSYCKEDLSLITGMDRAHSIFAVFNEGT